MSRATGLLVGLAAMWAAAGEIAAQSISPPQRFVAIGCISQHESRSTTGQPGGTGEPEFVITDARAEPPLVYRLDGDPKTLQLHVGHTVEVSGPLTPPASGAAGSTGTMKVQALVWIATTCADGKKN